MTDTEARFNPVSRLIARSRVLRGLADRPSREAVFEALSNERRRCALYYLQRQDGPVALGDVVDHVAAWQYDQPVDALDSKDRMCVYSALHQVHLPKLDETGFVDYDPETGEVRVRDQSAYARLYLEYDPGNDIPWSSLYLGLVAVGTTIATLETFAVGPFAWPGGLLIWALLGVFGVAALGHAVHEWRNKRSARDLFEVER